MTKVAWNAIGNEDGQTVTVIVPSTGAMLTADSGHPSFERILEILVSSKGDVDSLEELQDLFSVQTSLNRQFEKVSERVSIRNGKVYFDGDPVEDTITDVIVKFYNDNNDDFMPLVNFLEKIYQNPSENSRLRLFAWLRSLSFGILPNGNFLAYKSVYKTEDEEVFKSVSSGSAIVDGEPCQGQIPNKVGSVIEMPRSEVDDDTSRGCSTGLHAGTWGYASTFSGNQLLAVEINPRDVVSVPSDCSNAKLRTCRYTVYGLLDAEFDGLLVLDKRVEPSVTTEYGGDIDELEDDDDELLDFVGDGLRDEELEDDDDEVVDVAQVLGNPLAVLDRVQSLKRDQVRSLARRLKVYTKGASKKKLINSIGNGRTAADITEALDALNF